MALMFGFQIIASPLLIAGGSNTTLLYIFAALWGIGYGLFALVAIFTGVWTGRTGTEVKAEVDAEEATPVAGHLRVLWFAFPFCASVLLLAVTNEITPTRRSRS